MVIANYCYRLYQCYLEYLRFKKQGVIFNDKDGFSFIRDSRKLRSCAKENPNGCPWLTWQQHAHGVKTLPPITGVIIFDQLFLSINRVDFLEDIYVNKAKYYTKSIHAYHKYYAWSPKSIFIESSHA